MTETTLSTINLFLVSLRQEGFRKLAESRIRELNLVPPYDQLTHKLMSLEGDIKRQDFISICYTYLNPSDVETLEHIDVISSELGLKSLEELLGLSSLEKIQHILKRDTSIEKKLDSIGTLIETNRTKISTPHAKKIQDLEQKKETSLFKFLKYPFSKGKLYLVCAYSGVGKTNISLSLAKTTGSLGHNTHYISIADWTEPEIRNKIEKVNTYPDIWLSILDEATIYDIENEIEISKPDVCIVDSITDITSYANAETEYFWELERRARGLRRLATKYNMVLVTTHQLIVRDEKVIPEDMLGAKAHLLKVVDLALGIGCMNRDGFNTVSTLKVRHHRLLNDFKIQIDHEGCHIHYPK